MTLKTKAKSAALSIGIFTFTLVAWHLLTTQKSVSADSVSLSDDQKAELESKGMTESNISTYAETGLTYDQMAQIGDLGLSLEELESAGGLEAFGFTTGGAAEEATTGFPSPALVWSEASEQLSKPFYDKGPNDKGIGIQLSYSLLRVALGFMLAVVVAVPFGFLVGMSPTINLALAPFIQILKPISPLAWLPVALYIIKDAEQASIFVIFICSVWPMLINTAFGVASVNPDYLNIGRTLELNNAQMAFRVILPAAAPTIFTGMRISIGIAWLVIVAAEMVIGGIGMGYFVWNEWNGLNLASMIFAIFVIGVVGLTLDLMIGGLTRLVEYQD